MRLYDQSEDIFSFVYNESLSFVCPVKEEEEDYPDEGIDFLRRSTGDSDMKIESQFSSKSFSIQIPSQRQDQSYNYSPPIPMILSSPPSRYSPFVSNQNKLQFSSQSCEDSFNQAVPMNLSPPTRGNSQFSMSPHSFEDGFSPRSTESVFESGDDSYDDYGLEHDTLGHLWQVNMQGNVKEELNKLGTSKSPVIDALVFCALKECGVKVLSESSQLIQFEIDNFEYYYKVSQQVCSKANPTDDMYSRVKALRRWFPDFPSLKDLFHSDHTSVISISKKANRNNFVKLQAILQKQKVDLQKSYHTSVDESSRKH